MTLSVCSALAGYGSALQQLRRVCHFVWVLSRLCLTGRLSFCVFACYWNVRKMCAVYFDEFILFLNCILYYVIYTAIILIHDAQRYNTITDGAVKF